MAAVWPALLLTLERVFYHELDSIGWLVLGTFRHLLHCHDSFEVAKDFVVVFLSDVPFFGGLCCCKLFGLKDNHGLHGRITSLKIVSTI